MSDPRVPYDQNNPQHAHPGWGIGPSPRRNPRRALKVIVWLTALVVVAVLFASLSSSPSSTGDSPATPTPTTGSQAAPKARETAISVSQRQALKSAQSYIDLTGFSKAGLIKQLSSDAGEGFTRADATYAANHVGANWNTEAVQSARTYLDMGGFSRNGLIQQLSSPAGDGYTLKQATQAADKVGL